MMLGKLPVPGRPTIWIRVGQGPTALAVGAGGGCFDIFTLDYPFCPLSPSLWETTRYRLKYCFKGPLNPNNNQNHPRHLAGKRTAQKDTIIDITSDTQVNSNFPYRRNHKCNKSSTRY